MRKSEGQNAEKGRGARDRKNDSNQMFNPIYLPFSCLLFPIEIHIHTYIVNSHGITSHHIALHLLVKVKGALRRTSLIILNFMPF